MKRKLLIAWCIIVTVAIFAVAIYDPNNGPFAAVMWCLGAGLISKDVINAFRPRKTP